MIRDDDDEDAVRSQVVLVLLEGSNFMTRNQNKKRPLY